MKGIIKRIRASAVRFLCLAFGLGFASAANAEPWVHSGFPSCALSRIYNDGTIVSFIPKEDGMQLIAINSNWSEIYGNRSTEVVNIEFRKSNHIDVKDYDGGLINYDPIVGFRISLSDRDIQEFKSSKWFRFSVTKRGGQLIELNDGRALSLEGSSRAFNVVADCTSSWAAPPVGEPVVGPTLP